MKRLLVRLLKYSFNIASISTFFCFAPFTDAAQPHPWQVKLQNPATPVMENIYDLHNILLIVVCTVAFLVLIALIYVIFKFSEKRNKIPSQRTHHTLLEIIWTAIPALILLVIAVPSFKLLFLMDKAQDPEMTIKVIGHQWYWQYQYPDHDLDFDSNIIEEKDLKPNQLRLLDVDHPLIVPTNTTIRILITSADVLHSWAVPALGVKKDSIPGRLNETWIRIAQHGTYYGQCSELCGIRHGFMPIAVKALPPEEFKAWIKGKKPSAGSGPSPKGIPPISAPIVPQLIK